MMLHFPSYEFGRMFARFDVAADAVKEGDSLLSALLVIDDGEVPNGKPIGLLPSSFVEGYRFEAHLHDPDSDHAEGCFVCESLVIIREENLKAAEVQRGASCGRVGICGTDGDPCSDCPAVEVSDVRC